MPILIFSISVISFILFTIIHSLYPKNPISPYLIPRFLGDGQFSKSALRQTGTSWIVFSLWLLSITFTLPYLFPKGWLDGNFWIVGLFAFVIPVISIMLLIAGIYYICIGIFSRKEMITPALKTDRVIDPELREVYIKRLIRITKINLISLVLFIGVPIIEAILDVEANGYVALVNISFLITFIFSYGRIHGYVAKSALALGKPGEDFLKSEYYDNPIAIIFVWYCSFKVLSLYNKYKT